MSDFTASCDVMSTLRLLTATTLCPRRLSSSESSTPVAAVRIGRMLSSVVPKVRKMQSPVASTAAEPMDPRATEGKAELARAFQDVSTAVDATGLCIFLTFGTTLESIRPILTAATGVELSDEELLASGERIWNLERVWNLKAGITAADDTLPKRILEEPIPAGPAAGEVNRLGEMLPEYYRVRGWNEDGEPTPEKLRELGLA